jgi:hypothetical protein
MNFRPILLITFLCLLVPCRSAFCQGRFPAAKIDPDKFYAGYIINATGDTLKCEFKKPALGQLRYRPTNSTDKFKKPAIDAVKEYYSAYDSTVYIAMSTDTDSTDLEYLKRLENGTIKLYEEDITSSATYMNGMWSGGGTSVYYYISKNDGLMKQIKSNTLITGNGSRKSRREYLYQLFSDDPALAEKFKNDQNFDLQTLRHYISSYNADKSIAVKSK